MPSKKPRLPARTQTTITDFRKQKVAPTWSGLQRAALEFMETDPRRHELPGEDRTSLGRKAPSGSGPTHRPFIRENSGAVVEVLKKLGLNPPDTLVMAVRPPKGRGIVQKMVRFKGDGSVLDRHRARFNANKQLYRLKAPVPEPLSFMPLAEPAEPSSGQVLIERRFMGPSVQAILEPGRLNSDQRRALQEKVEAAKKKLRAVAKSEGLDGEWFKTHPVFDRLDKAYYDVERDRVVFDFNFEDLLKARKKRTEKALF